MEHSVSIHGHFLTHPEHVVSARTLAELQVTVSGDKQPGSPVDVAQNHEVQCKSASAVAVAAGSRLVVDVRDSADAWCRLFATALAPGFVKFAAGTWIRFPYGATALVSTSTELVARWGAHDAHCADAEHFGALQIGGVAPSELVGSLCAQFYDLGWVTGTGGSISIRHGERIFMAPSGVQKERIAPTDVFVLDLDGSVVYHPTPPPRKPRLKLSQCAPLFHQAFSLRSAGACIHTHHVSCVMATLLCEGKTELRITHQEMIKGIIGHGYLDELVIPIIENTPVERDLTDSLRKAIIKYPNTQAVLVRRHGAYIWGPTWEKAKTQAECVHYLLDVFVKMKQLGIDPAVVPGPHGSMTSANAAPGAAATACHGCGGDESCGSRKRKAVVPPPVTGAGAGAGAGAVNPAASRSLRAPVVLLDIDGTTTPTSFVKEVLLPAFSKDLSSYLATADWTQAALRELLSEAASSPVAVRGDATIRDTVEAYVRHCIATKQFTPAVKTLQGLVWEEGYRSGSIKGALFDDVPAALKALHAQGARVYLFSSGSSLAQALVFKHSKHGDLSAYISGYIDTTLGSKQSSATYRAILGIVGATSGSDVIFASDSVAELDAARAVGITTVLADRPGNVPVDASSAANHERASTFEHVFWAPNGDQKKRRTAE